MSDDVTRCIADPARPRHQAASLCGKDAAIWRFVDAGHAQANEESDGRLLVCAACAARSGIKVRALA